MIAQIGVVVDKSQKRQALENLNFLFRYVKKPLVDVIVTNYNYANYIGQCLGSIAAQDYPEWRCVVVDDASTDESINVIRSFIQKAPDRFELVCHERNGGQMEAFKTGLHETTGEFVLFVDADDILLPQCVTMSLAAHFYGDNVAFTCGAMAAINGDTSIKLNRVSNFPYERDLQFITVFPDSALPGAWPWSATSAMLFRRPVLEQVLPDDTDLTRICADNYLAHISNLLGGSLLIPETLALYRMHGKNAFALPTILGGIGCRMGDLEKNPPLLEIRRAIASQLIRNGEFFKVSLGPQALLNKLLKVASLGQLILQKQALKKAGIGLFALVRAWVGLRLVGGLKDAVRRLRRW